jgi:hypothetical protein
MCVELHVAHIWTTFSGHPHACARAQKDWAGLSYALSDQIDNILKTQYETYQHLCELIMPCVRTALNFLESVHNAKIQLPTYLIKLYAMRTYGGTEEWLHSFLTSALDENE